MSLNSPVGKDSFFIGYDHSFRFYILSEETGLPQNLTGWTLTYRLRLTTTSAVLVTKSTGSGITLEDGDGTNDVAVVAIADTDTTGFEEGWYVDSLVRTDTGTDIPLSSGAIYLTSIA